MNQQYWCSECKQPTEPRLWESGAGSGCHESTLMLPDDPRWIAKLPDGFDLALLVSVEYSDVYTRALDGDHEVFIMGFGPAKRTDRKIRGYYVQELRPLTDDEQADLTESLAEELHAERTPSERARAKIMGGI